MGAQGVLHACNDVHSLYIVGTQLVHVETSSVETSLFLARWGLLGGPACNLLGMPSCVTQRLFGLRMPPCGQCATCVSKLLSQILRCPVYFPGHETHGSLLRVVAQGE